MQSLRARVAGFLRSIRTLPYDQSLDFLRGFLGERMLSLSGFSIATRRLIYLAYALLVVMALWLLLLLLVEDGKLAQDPPSLAATLAVFVGFSVAWGLLLTGALYTRRAIRRGTLFFYLIVTANWVITPPVLIILSAFDEVSLLSPLSLLVLILLALAGVSLLLAAPVYFVLRRRAQQRPAVEFAILLLLVFVTYTTVYLQLAQIPGSVGDHTLSG